MPETIFLSLTQSPNNALADMQKGEIERYLNEIVPVERKGNNDRYSGQDDEKRMCGGVPFSLMYQGLFIIGSWLPRKAVANTSSYYLEAK